MSSTTFDSTLEALKVSYTSAQGQSSAGAVIKLSGSYGNGETLWVSFRVRVDGARYYDFETTQNRPAYKLAIISAADADGSLNTLGSNPANGECVIQMTWGNNCPTGYYYAPTLTHISNTYAQPSRDRGANPLTSTNPTTGAAWSAGDQTDARFGGIITSESNASEFAYGPGSPVSGGLKLGHDRWVTLTFRIEIGARGSANSRFSAWGAIDGEPYKHLWDAINITLGDAGADDITGIWLTAFLTDAQTGGVKVSSVATPISGVTIHCCGPATPVGDGVLAYTHSTGKLTWNGSGESPGTAIRYSTDIDGLSTTKLTFPVMASGVSSPAHGAGSYVVVTVAPNSLPGANASTTVVIADNRSTANIWYRDFIESVSPIPAPGGYMPIPAWLEGKSVNQWIDLGTSTRISSVDPASPPTPEGIEGPAAKIDDWTGYAWNIVDNKGYCVAQGGHGGYSGNEVDMLDLNRDFPAWVELRAPYATPPSGSSVAYYAANEPSSRHGYNGVWVYNGKCYHFGGSPWESGGAVSDIYTYTISTNVFSGQGSTSSLPNNEINQAMCQDPNGNVYMFGGTGAGTLKQKWTASSNVIANLNPSGATPGMYYASCAFDTTRNRILLGGGGGGDGGDAHHVYDVSSNSISTITFTGTHSSIINSNTNAPGMVYAEGIDRYLVRLTGDTTSTMYSIHPTTWAIEFVSTSGGTSIATLNPARPRYTKMAYLPKLGGVYLNGNYDTNSFFLKTNSVDLAVDAESSSGIIRGSLGGL